MVRRCAEIVRNASLEVQERNVEARHPWYFTKRDRRTRRRPTDPLLQGARCCLKLEQDILDVQCGA